MHTPDSMDSNAASERKVKSFSIDSLLSESPRTQRQPDGEGVTPPETQPQYNFVLQYQDWYQQQMPLQTQHRVAASSASPELVAPATRPSPRLSPRSPEPTHTQTSRPASPAPSTASSSPDGLYDGAVRRSKKSRTSFTTSQLTALERAYASHKYLSAEERCELAEQHRLSETQVKTWFQNRRMKEKRLIKDGEVYAQTAAAAMARGLADPRTAHPGLTALHSLAVGLHQQTLAQAQAQPLNPCGPQDSRLLAGSHYLPHQQLSPTAPLLPPPISFPSDMGYSAQRHLIPTFY